MTEIKKKKKDLKTGTDPCSGQPVKKRKAIDEDEVPGILQAQINNANDAEKAVFFGVAGKKRKNVDSPEFFSLESELVLHNGNSWIVLGYDRENFSPTSGQGGKGRPRCSSIDIVVGRGGYTAASHNNKGKRNTLGPNFTKDAARIFISQMSDPDSYFAPDNARLPRANLSETSESKPLSVVGMKADVLRFVARENIKLVTRTDHLNAQGGKCSAGDKSRYGISLVAMNGEGALADDIQPMVKGHNLVDCLKALVDTTNNLKTMIENLVRYNRNFKLAVMQHTHIEVAQPGKETSIAFKQMSDFVESILNEALDVDIPAQMDMMKQNNGLVNDWLSDGGGSTTDKYILSKYNFAN